ncbi:DUF4391 domain-containing protein [Collinsella ihumii]|uniref:DUF4391 domain-containing protein n=1 Tax=Collinsella ihumii TaxID=1720204 RepID=UPI0008342B49|nr:DUF4391 domain-containing protein [Collinsella ihumii]
MSSLTLGLPSTVLVGKTMPKKLFYEFLATTAAVKDEFVRLIERIDMVASIKEETLHIPASGEVNEIDVLGLYLRVGDRAGAEAPYAAIDLIAKSVSSKVLFVCETDDAVKLLVRRDRLYETAWLPCDETTVELRGSTLVELWDSLSSQVVFGNSEPGDFAGRVERKNRIEELQGELVSINKKRKSEKQIAKRNALFDRARAIKQELARLEAGA